MLHCIIKKEKKEKKEESLRSISNFFFTAASEIIKNIKHFNSIFIKDNFLKLKFYIGYI